MKLVVKIGGTLLDQAESRARLACEIADAARHNSIVVVHGGGRQMTRYLAERAIESRFVGGLRVTTPEILDAVLKIFAGTVNTELVAAFRAAGANPVGLTGVDAGLVDAELLCPDLGQVGRPVGSDGRLLDVLVGAGYLPVIACVAGDAAGAIYNVNADRMAVACASAFGAQKLVFLTDVEGVRDTRGTILSSLTASEARDLIQSGVATGGMQAKLEAALAGLEEIHDPCLEIRICAGSCQKIIDKILSGYPAGTSIINNND